MSKFGLMVREMRSSATIRIRATQFLYYLTPLSFVENKEISIPREGFLNVQTNLQCLTPITKRRPFLRVRPRSKL